MLLIGLILLQKTIDSRKNLSDHFFVTTGDFTVLIRNLPTNTTAKDVSFFLFVYLIPPPSPIVILKFQKH